MKANCVVCGKEFEKCHPNAVLCGQPACFEGYESLGFGTVRLAEEAEASRERERLWKLSRRKVRSVTCGTCGKVVTWDRQGNRKFCSVECRREEERKRRLAYEEAHREERRQYHRDRQRKYYHANPGKKAAARQDPAARARKSEYMRSYYEKNRVKILKRQHEYKQSKTQEETPK